MSDHPTRQAALWMIGAVCSFSALAVAGRIVLTDLTPLQLMFFRNLISVSVLLGCLPWLGRRSLLSAQPGTHLLRHGIHFLGQYAWFMAIALIPLAEVFALEFTTPIWALIFAALILGEPISPQRLAAVMLGLLGVLIIIRPGLISLQWGSLVILAGALCYGMTHTLTRKITRTDTPGSVIFYMNIVQLPLATVCFLIQPAWPELWHWPCLLAIGLSALTAHFCMAKALSLAPTALVVPMDFLRLPLIAVVGAWVFAESIDLWVFAGASVMFVGIFLNLRESSSRRNLT